MVVKMDTTLVFVGNAPSRVVTEQLLGDGARELAFEPVATPAAGRFYGTIDSSYHMDTHRFL